MLQLIKENDDYLKQAAKLSLEAHKQLSGKYPWLPSRSQKDYEDRIAWMTREGFVLAEIEGSEVLGFIAYFVIDNFRNAGQGAYTPDWCIAFSDHLTGKEKTMLQRELIRKVLEHCVKNNIRLHGISILATEFMLNELLSLTGYGRIVLDAANPTEILNDRLKTHIDLRPLNPKIRIKKAKATDAGYLALLNAHLAEHIAASPVLMPDTQSDSEEDWKQWINEPETAAFLAVTDDIPIGYIKAEEPQFDVTYTVHDSKTMGINGMYVDPKYRGQNIGTHLLSALHKEAQRRGKMLMSVDCETTNPEAYGFWTQYFEPLSWSLERRF